MPEGPARGMVVPLDQMLDQYYELRGWTSNGEIPLELLEK